MSRKHSTSRSHIVIRMGAAHHDVTLHYADSSDTFDLRSMSLDQRGRFHGAFMGYVRRQLRRAA